MRSREAWTEPKKDGEMVPQVSPIELSPNREALEPHNPSREHDNVERIPEVTPIAFNHTGERVGAVTDRTYHEGEVLSPEYRVRIECDCPLGSCLRPRRTSHRKINVAGTLGDSVPGALYEPQQFIIAAVLHEPG